MAPDAKETCCLACQAMNISVEFAYVFDTNEDEEEEEEPSSVSASVSEAETDEEMEPSGLPNFMMEGKNAEVDEQDTQKEPSLQIRISRNEQLINKLISDLHDDMESRIRALQDIIDDIKLKLDQFSDALLAARTNSAPHIH